MRRIQAGFNAWALGNRRDFVGFFRRRHLAQAEVLLGRPRAHQVQRAELAEAGPTQSLAIDGNVFDVEFLGDGGDPTLEALLKRPRIDAVKDTLEGVVRRDGVGKLQKAS